MPNGLLTNGSQVRYYPFGDVRLRSGEPQTQRQFTDQYLDSATGLMYYSDGSGYGRYYEPGTGRWLQPDLVVPNAGNPQSLNRYSYVNNNPLRHNDPTGHWVETAWDIANIAQRPRAAQPEDPPPYAGGGHLP